MGAAAFSTLGVALLTGSVADIPINLDYRISVEVNEMTRIFLAVWLVAFAVAPVAAQEVEMTDEQLDQLTEILRANLRAEKVKWIEANAPLTSEQAEVFWALYRRYERDRTEVGNEWLANVEDYAAHHENLSEAKAKELLDRSFEVQKKLLDVETRHKNEMMKRLPATVVARFFQVERRLNLLIDLETASQIPLVQ